MNDSTSIGQGILLSMKKNLFIFLFFAVLFSSSSSGIHPGIYRLSWSLKEVSSFRQRFGLVGILVQVSTIWKRQISFLATHGGNAGSGFIRIRRIGKSQPAAKSDDVWIKVVKRSEDNDPMTLARFASKEDIEVTEDGDLHLKKDGTVLTLPAGRNYTEIIFAMNEYSGFVEIDRDGDSAFTTYMLSSLKRSGSNAIRRSLLLVILHRK